MGLKDIADFAISKVGCGYVYGATGWVCSPARRKQQAKQYPAQESNILGVCAKWDGKVCYDCAQLVKAACKQAGVVLPSGATSQWNKVAAWAAQGTIDTMPDEPGVILFRKADGKMQHVEVYVGNGQSCGARSSKLGVGIFPMSGYNWTHWARPLVELSEDGNPLPQWEQPAGVTYRVVAETGSTVFLRPHPSKSSPYLARVPVGTLVSGRETSEAEKGWTAVAYGPLLGFMMNDFLKVVG